MKINLKTSLVLLALVLGFLVRLWHINRPIIDWHSHRQSDTASVTRIFVNEGIDLLHPRYYDLSSVQSGKDNPQGWRMVEMPLYNGLAALFSNSQNVEIISRLITIFMSLGSAFLIYLIVRKNTGKFGPAFSSLLIFLFLPFNIFYSRVILPEPSAVFFMLLTLYLFPKNIILSAIPFAVSILQKPYTALLLFPILITISFHQKYFFRYQSILKLIIFSVLTLLPFYFWRQWISQFPEGIPASSWLFNNSDKPFLPEWYRGYNLTFFNKLVAFRPYWFEWLFINRPILIISHFGFIPLFLAFALRFKHHLSINFSCILGILFYFIIVAGGNIRHDYYQVLIIPFISILIGQGLYFISRYLFKSPLLGTFISVSLFFIIITTTYSNIKNYYNQDHPEFVIAGEYIRQNTPVNSLIVTPTVGDTTFLYQTHRFGYPVTIDNFNELYSRHPERPIYVVLFNQDDYSAKLLKSFPIFYKTDKFVILKATP